jgi:hypothetical protein
VLQVTFFCFVQDVVKTCGDMIVLFDNRTVDAQHQQDKLKKLMDAVDSVISSHGGIPFSNQMFSQIKVIKILVLL